MDNAYAKEKMCVNKHFHLTYKILHNIQDDGPLKYGKCGYGYGYQVCPYRKCFLALGYCMFQNIIYIL